MPEVRKASFDIFAYTEDGRYLNIEMQRAKHPFFIDRVLYYNAFLTLKAKAMLGNSKDFKSLSRDERCQRRYEFPENISIWICRFHPRASVALPSCQRRRGTDLPDGGSDAIRRAIERITIANANEELLKSQEKYMIDQDEKDCRIANSYLKGREQGLVQGLVQGANSTVVAMERLGK